MIRARKSLFGYGGRQICLFPQHAGRAGGASARSRQWVPPPQMPNTPSRASTPSHRARGARNDPWRSIRAERPPTWWPRFRPGMQCFVAFGTDGRRLRLVTVDTADLCHLVVSVEQGRWLTLPDGSHSDVDADTTWKSCSTAIDDGSPAWRPGHVQRGADTAKPLTFCWVIRLRQHGVVGNALPSAT